VTTLIKNPYVILIAFFVSFVWFINFSNAVLPVHFIKSGLSFPQIAFGTLLSMFAQLVTLLVLSKIRVINKIAWWIAILIYSIIFTLYVLVPHSTIFYISSFSGGIASILFYAFYNVSHFELTPRDKTGTGAAVFFNILTIVSIIAPVTSGLVASLSMNTLLICSLIFALIPLVLSFKQKPILISYTIRNAMKEVRSVKWVIILSGIYDALGYGVIPLITLTLITNSLDFGSFKTFLTLFTVVAGFVVGKWSDKLPSKSRLLVTLSAIVGIITLIIALPFATSSIYYWSGVNILLGLFSPLYNQTNLSYVLDSTQDRVQAIFGREILLNLGRFFGMGIVLLGFIFPILLPFSIIAIALSVLGLSLLVYKNHKNTVL